MSSALAITSTPKEVHETVHPAVSQARTVPSHILTEGRRSDAKAPPEETLVALPMGGDRP